MKNQNLFRTSFGAGSSSSQKLVLDSGSSSVFCSKFRPGNIYTCGNWPKNQNWTTLVPAVFSPSFLM